MTTTNDINSRFSFRYHWEYHISLADDVASLSSSLVPPHKSNFMISASIFPIFLLPFLRLDPLMISINDASTTRILLSKLPFQRMLCLLCRPSKLLGSSAFHSSKVKHPPSPRCRGFLCASQVSCKSALELAPPLNSLGFEATLYALLLLLAEPDSPFARVLRFLFSWVHDLGLLFVDSEIFLLILSYISHWAAW